MTQGNDSLILTLNAGSSSLKFALFRMGIGVEERRARGELLRIGLPDATFTVQDNQGGVIQDRDQPLPDFDAAFRAMLSWLVGHLAGRELDAFGHRIVQGGPDLDRPQPITSGVLVTLRRLVPLAPNHLPSAIRAVEILRGAHPETPQIGCFDTTFHRTLPPVARTFAIPYLWTQRGVRRYGFHGLSYEYLLEELHREAGDDVAMGRLVMAHLGNGASMVAVRGGQSVDTTMGLTPLGGLVMGTRGGDLDPGVVLYLFRELGLSLQEVDEMLSKQSGMLGVSGISPDMHDLGQRADKNPRAALARDLFCYQARKHLAALAASLGGLDTLIFTAGIGEHAADVRQQICCGLEFMGIRLDPARNAAHAPIISAEGSTVTVRVMATNEELMIARQSYGVLRGTPTSEVLEAV